jgi:hypothetical protein
MRGRNGDSGAGIIFHKEGWADGFLDGVDCVPIY